MRRRATMAAVAFALAAAALALPPASLAAGPGLPPTVTDTVPGHPGVTYLQLLRQALPGLAYNPATKQVEAHLASLRHIAGKDQQKDPPDPVVAGSVQALHIKAGGRPRLALVADLGVSGEGATTLLALYDDAPKPRLLDAVDVGIDEDTSLNHDPSTIPLGPGDDALVTYSEHLDSNRRYRTWLVIFERGDRFHLLDLISLVDDRACGFDRKEKPTFATSPGTPYATLVLTVTETVTHRAEACGDQKVPAPYVHAYHTTFRWDAAKGEFVGQGDMDQLDKLIRSRL